MTSDEIIGLLKTYVNKTLVGGGALKGKNCTIDSIAPITGGSRVTFKWTLDDGTVETGHLDVMNGLNGQDGEDGKDGKGIQSVSVNENNHLIITYSDGTTTDAGQIEIHSAVDSVNGKTGAVTLDASDVGALPDNTAIPSKTSDLTNDSGFITKAVNDLVNYYLKSETYSKTQVDDIVTAVKNSRFEVVATLPTTDIKTNVIYLVPKSPSQTSNVKDEYINLDGTTSGWEKIGDTEIDLSDYVTTEALNTALAAYTTTADLTTLLAAKQDTLTFDNAPTKNSNNPVKSGGVYADEKSIYEVMGRNGAKNKEPFNIDVVKALNTTGTWTGNSYELNGITFAFADDGKVTVSGTASALCSITISGNYDLNGGYIITGCPSGGGSSTYSLRIYDSSATVVADDVGEGVSFTANNLTNCKTNLIVRKDAAISTPIVFAPMIRDSKDTDPTYQPYTKTNQELTAENEALTNQANDMVNVLGAKNLLPTPYYATKGGTTTSGALSATENADGSVTINGTATGQSYIDLARNDKFLKAGTYILSGGLTSKQYVYINCLNNGTYVKTLVSAMTSEAKFVLDYNGYDAITVGISIASGEALSNTTFYPMIRLASDSDSTYVPYAKTNRQLTNETDALMDNILQNGSINIYDIFHVAVNVGNSGDSSKVVINAEDGTITFKAGTYANYAEVRLSPHLTKSPYGIEVNKKYTLMYNILSGTKPSNMSMRADYSPADSWANFVNLKYTTKTKMPFTSSPVPYYMIIAIRCIESEGGTLSNDITIKPLLVYTEQDYLVDNITDYPLYAMTNRELTKVNVAEVNILIQTAELAQYRVRKCGKVVECTISLQVNEAVTAWTDFATVPEGFRPSTYIQAVSNKTMYTGFAVVQIAPNGGIQSSVNLAVGDRVRFTAVWICP